MPRVRVPIFLVLMVMVLVVAPAVSFAKPDFSRTTIALDPAVPQEGDVITYRLHIRNTGDEAAPFTEVELKLPREAMFVDVTGLDDGKGVPTDERMIVAMLDLPAGADRQFAVRMVIPRDAGGNSLSPRLKVRYAHKGVEFYGGESVTIDTRVAQTGVVLGGVRFNPAALAVIGVLLLYPVLRLLTASRKESRGPAVLTVISVGFLLIFAAMAYDDWRTLYGFQQSSCTILDSRVRIETEASSTGGRVRTPSSDNVNVEPLLALRYSADGREMIGTGYSTDSRLGIGMGSSTIREAAQFKIGAQVPCWFDPRDPVRVVVIPGFGGAYFFALLPLALFVAGVYGLTSRSRRR